MTSPRHSRLGRLSRREEPVVVERREELLGDVLDDVPVFDDLVSLDPEDVDDGASRRAGHQHRVDVKRDRDRPRR